MSYFLYSMYKEIDNWIYFLLQEKAYTIAELKQRVLELYEEEVSEATIKRSLIRLQKKEEGRKTVKATEYRFTLYSLE